MAGALHAAEEEIVSAKILEGRYFQKYFMPGYPLFPL